MGDPVEMSTLISGSLECRDYQKVKEFRR